MTKHLLSGLLMYCLPIFLLPTQAESLVDPTKPALVWKKESTSNAHPKTATTPAPSGILIRNGKAMLFIGDHYLHEGEKWGIYRIEKIGKDRVWLRNDSGLVEWQLPHAGIQSVKSKNKSRASTL